MEGEHDLIGDFEKRLFNGPFERLRGSGPFDKLRGRI
jgi:hypothetical protein